MSVNLKAAILFCVGGVILLILNAIFGLYLSHSGKTPLVPHWVGSFSSWLGFVYSTAWSLSFYPQIYLNWKRKSVVGLSLDFEAFNIIGFACYGAYNMYIYVATPAHSDSIVQPSDLFFSFHAILLTLYTIFQCVIYDRGTQRVSLLALLFSVVVGLGCIIYAIVLALTHGNWVDFMYLLSTVKLVVTGIKYCPQAWLNFQRKSTVGWNIMNVILDFTGGSLSLAQLFLDVGANPSENWLAVFKDPAKFGLGVLSICFDVLFMLQHYVFYRSRHDPCAAADEFRKQDADLKVPILQ